MGFVFLIYAVIPNPAAHLADGVRDLLLPLPFRVPHPRIARVGSLPLPVSS
jgi:hypothetical protein